MWLVVGKIGRTMIPVEAELGLGFMAEKPMDSELNHLGAPLDDGVLEEACCIRVVSLEG